MTDTTPRLVRRVVIDGPPRDYVRFNGWSVSDIEPMNRLDAADGWLTATVYTLVEDGTRPPVRVPRQNHT